MKEETAIQRGEGDLFTPPISEGWHRRVLSPPYKIGAGALLFLFTTGLIYFLFNLAQLRRNINSGIELQLQRSDILFHSRSFLLDAFNILSMDQLHLITASEVHQTHMRLDTVQRDLIQFRECVEKMNASIFSGSIRIVTRKLGEADSLMSQALHLADVLEKKNNLSTDQELQKNILSLHTHVYTLLINEVGWLISNETQFVQQERRFQFNTIRKWTLRWLYIALLFLALALSFAVLFIRRERKTTNEMSRFWRILEYSPNPIQIVNVNGDTRYANPAFLKWCGYATKDLENKKVIRTMYPVNNEVNTESVWELAQASLQIAKTWSDEIRFQRPDGKISFADVILTPVLDGKGKLVECIVLHTDLTEKRENARKVIETQKQYRQVVENSLDGLIVIQDSTLVFINPAAIRIFGFSDLEEIRRFQFLDLIAPSSRSMFIIEHQRNPVKEEEIRNIELRAYTKQRELIDLEANARIVQWNGRPAVLASIRDITERKMIEREQALWLKEQEVLSEIDRKLVGEINLEKILDAILHHTITLTHADFTGVLLVDQESKNAQWKAVHGNDHDFPSEYFKIDFPWQSILKNEEFSVVDETENSKYKISEFPEFVTENIKSLAFLPLKVEQRVRGILVVGYKNTHDFSGKEIRLLLSLAEKNSIAMVNAQLYDDLLQREKELELLSGARVQAQEIERRRIAREIHDGLGQLLTAIKFNLEILEDAVQAGTEERERMNDMKNLLDEVMKEARELSYNLMPSVLEDFGLIPALQLLCEQFTARTNVKIDFQVHGGTDRFAQDVEIGIYRIAQEALNNIQKHANATEINFQIIHGPSSLRMTIEDNGKGFVTHTITPKHRKKGGMGLVSMQERASLLGGTFTIDSVASQGTFICIEIPIKQKESI